MKQSNIPVMMTMIINSVQYDNDVPINVKPYSPRRYTWGFVCLIFATITLRYSGVLAFYINLEYFCIFMLGDSVVAKKVLVCLGKCNRSNKLTSEEIQRLYENMLPQVCPLSYKFCKSPPVLRSLR